MYENVQYNFPNQFHSIENNIMLWHGSHLGFVAIHTYLNNNIQ